jgi:hypothetical protein
MTLAERLQRKRVPSEPQFSRAVLTACAAVRRDPKYMLPDGELAMFDRDADLAGARSIASDFPTTGCFPFSRWESKSD